MGSGGTNWEEHQEKLFHSSKYDKERVSPALQITATRKYLCGETHFCKTLNSFLFQLTENRRNNSPPKDRGLKHLNPASSNAHKLEANTTGAGKKNKLKVFIVANEAFKHNSSNRMFKTLLHYFYDSSRQHATKQVWAVINFLQPCINIIGILSSVILLALKAEINKSITTPLLLCLLSLHFKSLLLFLLGYQCNHFQLQQTV